MPKYRLANKPLIFNSLFLYTKTQAIFARVCKRNFFYKKYFFILYRKSCGEIPN